MPGGAKTEDTKPRGRPRQKKLDRRIIGAAWQLMDEKPLAGISVKEIAERAGTTRAAVYRRWSSVERVAIDAFLDAVEHQVPKPTTAYPPDALKELVVSLARFLNGRTGRAIVEILGRAQANPELLSAFHDGFFKPRRNLGRSIILQGQEEGHFRRDIESELIVDMYAGPMYLRAFAKHAALDEAFAESLVEQLLIGIQTS